MLQKVNPNKPLRWQRSKYSLFQRQIDIFTAAGKLLFYTWWDNKVAPRDAGRRDRRARWLVATLIDLGPTFIKIGQALSTRADLLPLEYVKALATLQDRVPEFSSEEAIAAIESELGHSLHALYRDFDPFPIAAASLGQVHKARLHTGEEAIVKVQRPGLEQLFALDFKVLYDLVQLANRFFPWARKYELKEIYREFIGFLSQEIDYLIEGKNADRFRENFEGNSQVLVPKIYWRYTTKRILTMEYLPGTKIDDRHAIEAMGLDVCEINRLGISCYLKQLLLDGFFQADPHPGNMAVTPDGRLIFYDFGMMAELKPLAKDRMIRTFFAVLKKDTDAVLKALIEMGLIVPVSDMRPVRRLLNFLLENFTEKPIDVKAFGEIRSEIYSMFQQQPFRLPAQMTFIIKSLTTLDGIARTLDPQYNLRACMQPFVKSITLERGKVGAISELAQQTRHFIKERFQKPSAAEVLLTRLEKRLESGELQLQVRSIESDRALNRLNLSVKSLIYACLSGFTFLAGAVLLLGPYGSGAIVAFAISAIAFLLLLRSLLRLAIKEKLDRLAQ